MSDIKLMLRNNKAIKSVISPIYRTALAVSKYPKEIKYSKALINELKGLESSDNLTVWYCCAPTHKNLGDLAQKCCITRWIKQNYPDARIVEVTSRAFDHSKRKITKLLNERIKPTDLIIMQSGYTMTGNHPYTNLQLAVVNNFKNNKIVFFPQTVLFANEKVKRKTVNAIDRHGNVIMLTRDKQSYEMAKDAFKNTKIYLYPDIVTSEIGKHDFKHKRDGVLFCMRNDAEQLYTKKEISQLIEKMNQMGNVQLTDTTVNWEITSFDYEPLWKQIFAVIESYSKYRLIITDRYHGTIFSLIAGTPVIVLKTTDHKVATGVDWFKGVCDDYVSLAENLDNAYEKAKNVLSDNNYEYKLEQYFAEGDDICDRKKAAAFRDQILKRGGEADGMTMYRAFRGQDPDAIHMLRSRGLADEPAEEETGETEASEKSDSRVRDLPGRLERSEDMEEIN